MGKRVLRHFSSDTISTEELISEMDAAIKVPGLRNAWTMPIKGRIDMLTSGIRTPVGLKISGDDPKDDRRDRQAGTGDSADYSRHARSLCRAYK